MRQNQKIHLCQKLMLGTLSLVLAALLGLSADLFSIVSLAESPSKVTATSAYIRKSADADSEVLASVKKGDKVSIKAQTKDSAGTVWYQVFVDADQLGFISSNLVSITDGSTPPTMKETTTIAPTVNVNQTQLTASTAPVVQNVSTAPQVAVTEVNPTSATVLKGVRVRKTPSTDSNNIITTVDKGLALTVTGWADGSDGYKWWRVNFTMNGKEVTGFIRSDYVEDINPTEPGNEEPAPATPEPEEPKETEEPKEWEIQDDNGVWYLVDSLGQYSEDHLTPHRYNIADMFKTVADNQKAYNSATKTAKNLKVVIVILVLLIVALAAVITILIFKLRDLDDSVYFAEAERENARRRSADRPQGGAQRTMQGRPMQGQRSVQGQGRPMQGQGQGRPMQGQGQGRPMQGQGQGRPVQGQGQGRPMQGQGQGRPMQGQGQGRPVQGQRPGMPQNSQEAPRPRGPVESQERAPREENQGGGQKPGWKSKNFMNDEDEFEFLNWDGDEK